MRKILVLLPFVLVTLWAKPVIVLETTMGDITLELYEKKIPLATENFTKLTEKGYYNGTIFHRVIKGFMIQGGDPTGTGRGGNSIWGKPFKDEFTKGLTFDQSGVLAMANRGPNTNGSQFFITVEPTRWLNGHYTIFGKVIKGMDVVENINNVLTSGNQKGNRPLKPVKIIKAYVVKSDTK